MGALDFTGGDTQADSQVGSSSKTGASSKPDYDFTWIVNDLTGFYEY